MSDENMELLLRRLDAKIQELKQELKQEVKADIDELDKRWNERFFQLSRETLGFARNVIVTAAVVAVLVPLAKEALVLVPKLLEP
jgi:hypothetical protein